MVSVRPVWSISRCGQVTLCCKGQVTATEGSNLAPAVIKGASTEHSTTPRWVRHPRGNGEQTASLYQHCTDPGKPEGMLARVLRPWDPAMVLLLSVPLSPGSPAGRAGGPGRTGRGWGSPSRGKDAVGDDMAPGKPAAGMARAGGTEGWVLEGWGCPSASGPLCEAEG